MRGVEAVGLGIAGAQYRWPRRTVPFVVDPAFPDPDRVTLAISHWNERSCIRFVPRGNEADYVRIARLPGFALSDVGRRGGEQQVALGDGCTVGSIIHELGHTVGLWHEHCRSDRGDWVTVDFTNVEDGCEENFEIAFICGIATPTVDLGDYDYGSIMHYPAGAFPIDRDLPTITALRPLAAGVVMGQRQGLSAGDLAAIEELCRDEPRPA